MLSGEVGHRGLISVSYSPMTDSVFPLIDVDTVTHRQLYPGLIRIVLVTGADLSRTFTYNDLHRVIDVPETTRLNSRKSTRRA